MSRDVKSQPGELVHWSCSTATWSHTVGIARNTVRVATLPRTPLAISFQPAMSPQMRDGQP
ncbi:hypothetical protein EIQ06_14925 [Xanthomonas campestris pv. campestris]|uniref:Uncharacterized protein n=1 Tax=Xanthomonas campestris pv. campestris (strain B100) TaxID=509169 RepID=A0A1X7QES3_XANCB|nr:hypothetical protein DFG55_04180 [Xanthomonas campestris pv. campestris]RFF42015.1 hypothetical protein D0A38_17410 [Xanthomonas campestris pv. incanae]RFF52671.1 hypothetical protein D0A35_02950 [Xanthomonas campestris]RFF67080.1 hypothetical protein D0A40_11925 [Xanthomonas campestris pv. raphani]QCX69912.1 hypothetical protein DFG54_03195 [Xanthomonas campestris pv. campestris]